MSASVCKLCTYGVQKNAKSSFHTHKGLSLFIALISFCSHSYFAFPHAAYVHCAMKVHTDASLENFPRKERHHI